MLVQNVDNDILDRELRIIPGRVLQALGRHTVTAGKHYLDFGCDLGLKTLGYALSGKIGRVTGVDVQDNFRNIDDVLHRFGIARPPILTFELCGPQRLLANFGPFDGMISWSVFEHVRADIFASVCRDLFRAVAPGGICFIQVNPLFHAPMGAHLWGLLEPWEHLRSEREVLNLIDMRAGSDERRAASMSLYKSLNRFRLSDFRRHFAAAGFEILEEKLGRTSETPPDDLLGRFDPDDLTIEGFQMILRRPHEI